MDWRGAHFFIVGDSADLPVLRDLLGRLPEHAYGQVLVEVASPRQIEHLEVPEGVSLTWLRRDLAGSAAAPIAPRGELVARAVGAWVAEWMPELHDDPGAPYALWVGCAASDRVDRLFIELSARMPDLHVHHGVPPAVPRAEA